MPLDGFDRLYHDADARPEPIRVAAAGGEELGRDDATS